LCVGFHYVGVYLHVSMWDGVMWFTMGLLSCISFLFL